jgi:hypothetical protein
MVMNMATKKWDGQEHGHRRGRRRGGGHGRGDEH